MIPVDTRVFVSCVDDYGKVTEIIKTGIVGIVKYRIRFADGFESIYGAGYVQPSAGRAVLRLVVNNDVRIGL